MTSIVNAVLTPESVTNEVRAWVREHWNPTMSLVAWRELLVDSGYAVPAWPEEWFGKGWPDWTVPVVQEAIWAEGAVGIPVGGGTGLAGPTILTHGPDSVRQRFLRPLLTGEESWCQLFSEPGAGSDLAGLTTKAERDGDEWVISGQKLWNTSAHHADFGILIARSDWDAVKHGGLTYFALPMKQSGVEVRGLKQMNYHSSFTEVFLNEARIPNEFVIGEPGQGWSVALTTLAFERRMGSMGRPRYSEGEGAALEEARHEAEEYFKTYSWYPQRTGRTDLVVPQAQSSGKIADPVVRQEMMKLLSVERTSQWMAARARAALAAGRAPGAEGSLAKLAVSEIARQANRVHTLIAGASGMLRESDREVDAIVGEVLISTPAQSIAGGTDEIQRNIIGEKVLGLPREPSVGKDLPFRLQPRNG